MSEFGTGYAYNLGLFLAHAERLEKHFENISPGLGPSMWFCAAGDHLLDLIIPDVLPAKKRGEIAAWKEKCLAQRFSDATTYQDVAAAISYAKQLLLEWDIACGLAAERADWA